MQRAAASTMPIQKRESFYFVLNAETIKNLGFVTKGRYFTVILCWTKESLEPFSQFRQYINQVHLSSLATEM